VRPGDSNAVVPFIEKERVAAWIASTAPARAAATGTCQADELALRITPLVLEVLEAAEWTTRSSSGEPSRL
jgi:hypothetical protein